MASIIQKTKNNRTTVVYLNNDETSPLFVHDYGYHKTEPNHTFGPAIRPYFLIHLIASGKGTFEKAGVKTTLSVGDAFIIRPGEVTVYSADKNDPWEYYWISFSGIWAETVMRKTTTESCVKAKKGGLMSLIDVTKNSITNDVELLSVLFSVLNSIKSDEKMEDSDVINLAVNYIEKNYFRNFNASTLADNLKVSRSYFTTTFTNKTGETPYNYLLKVRIKKAQDYLKNSNLSVTEIAYSVGFSSIERFSEMFKKHTGQSPSKYRNYNRGNNE